MAFRDAEGWGEAPMVVGVAARMPGLAGDGGNL